MTRWLAALCLWLVVGAPALAQAVRVTSGEHDDFTRLVLEFPGPVDWTLGRTADGYALRLNGPAPVYDLSRAFDLIGKGRLAAIRADEGDGLLYLSIACPCFAMPFEFRPGTVVIDLRNGEPPEGSSFEEPLAGTDLAETGTPPVIRPMARASALPEVAAGPPPAEAAEVAAAETPPGPGPAYDWLDQFREGPRGRSELATSALGLSLSPPETIKPDLEPLRRALVEQLGRGATQGIVDMAPPKRDDKAKAEPRDEEANPSVEIRLGDAPNLDLRQKGEEMPALTARGEACIPDEKLAIAEWVAETPVAEQIGPALADLIGEFDRPDPEAVARAVRFNLGLGFGAEARSLLRAFPSDQEDAAIWQSMAHILDGEAEETPAFEGMAACDTAAALWALLSDPEVLALGQVEKAAVLRAFSALPIHLRQHLGPRLVDRFLAMKDLTTATALRESILRGTTEPGPEIEMMEAAFAKAGGSPVTAATRLEEVVKDGGPTTPEATAELVIQRAELGLNVGYDLVQALEGFAEEREGTEDSAQFELALTLAHAASGDFAAAFGRLEVTPEAEPVLWKLLAQAGGDSPLLEFSVLAEGQEAPPVAHASATLIAQRLVTLGLADQAARWLQIAPDVPPLLAAKVALGLGNPEGALALIGDTQSKPADDLRLAAHAMLGDEAAVAAIHAAQGETEAEWQAVSRMRDWPRLAAEGPETWQKAARSLLGTPATAEGEAALPPPAGPLERDRRLVEDSADTRAAISALLDSVPLPQPPTQ